VGFGLGFHANETATVVVVDVDVVGVDVAMIKSTGMDCGVLVAPVAVTVMVVG